MEPIVNRVAESDIEVFDLSALWQVEGATPEVVSFDLAPFLFQGIILKEKDFRADMKAHDWSAYANKVVAVHCSADAIIPTWAYMLVASKLKGHAFVVGFGEAEAVIRDHFVRALESLDWAKYQDRIVVIKGCGNQVVPLDAYMIATQKLQQVARKLMYGEPCSSVPLWRRPKVSAA